MKKEKTTEEELILFEKGFEEGYAMAKRLYKPDALWVLNANNESIKIK